ncbi:MAG: SRPBCC domain-containing protein, partial [Rhodospirillaceae bacterium]|nr:SRPBCC domain-containing protein [Rhodospirillaceae bacterium]
MILSASAAKELVLTRVFNAPRERVFRAWTTPESARHWWGPVHHPAVSIAMDVKVGGKWNAALRSEETGKILTHHGVFLEIAPPERLSFTFVWDEEGERGLETVVSLFFENVNG